MCNDLFGMTRKIDQQIEFLGSKSDLFPANQRAMSGEIDREIPHFNFLIFWLRRRKAPQIRSNPSKQFIHVERFGDVVVRAGVESFDLGAFLAAYRKDDDRDLRFASYPLRQLNAAD